MSKEVPFHGEPQTGFGSSLHVGMRPALKKGHHHFSVCTAVMMTVPPLQPKNYVSGPGRSVPEGHP